MLRVVLLNIFMEKVSTENGNTLHFNNFNTLKLVMPKLLLEQQERIN